MTNNQLFFFNFRSYIYIVRVKNVRFYPFCKLTDGVNICRLEKEKHFIRILKPKLNNLVYSTLQFDLLSSFYLGFPVLFNLTQNIFTMTS